MRVLFAITRGETGGAQRHLEVLADGLLRRDHSVGVVTEPDASLFDSPAIPAATLFEWPSISRDPNPRKDLRARRELRSVVQRYRPDVLALYSSKAGVLGRCLLPRDSGVTVFTCHHTPFGPGREWSHRVLGRAVEQLTLRWVDGIITDGTRDMPMLRKLAPRVPIVLVPNAVSPPSGSPNLAEGQIGTNALWLARLRRPKDPVQAVRAWKLVNRGEPSAQLHLCGTGPLESRVRAAAGDLLGQSVQLHGFVPSVERYASISSVFVLASNAEGGITMATLEAMAQGLVPVVSDVGDAFMLEQEQCGIVVPRRAPGTLAEAVLHLFRNHSDRIAMRTRALRFSRELWTPDRLVESTLSFYRQLLRG